MTFEEWLKTHHGAGSVSWPVDGPIYLKNRLWWAYEAGVQEGLRLAAEALPKPKEKSCARLPTSPAAPPAGATESSA